MLPHTLKMKSHYGDRNTVGTQYLEAQKNSVQGLTIGDINYDMLNGFVEDINTTIESNPYEGRPFYINIVEQRDLLMKNAFKRRIFTTLYRPFPEDNTTVFYTDPRKEETLFCWDLPHHSEMLNIVTNRHLYDKDYYEQIKSFCSGDFVPFGFIKVEMNSSQVDGYNEKVINAYRQNYYNHCANLEMDEKSIENERRLGFFWIPNKAHKDKTLKKKSTLISLDGSSL